MLCLTVCISLLAGCVVCNPVPPPIHQLPDNAKTQDHQVDNVEVHHDVNSDVQNQKLANDLLPDQSIDAVFNDAAGDRQLSHDEQQQQHPPDQVMPLLVDGNTSRTSQSKNDESRLSLNFAGEMKELPLEKLIPVDHLDVVKMEQDGHINKEYHKEMFLGDQHDEFKTETVENAEAKLKEIVAKADIDKDGCLSKTEIEKWILEKMMEHFEKAKRENAIIFKHLDPDGDGFIRWKEYYVHFLMSRGVGEKEAWQHVKDYDDSVPLDQDDKDALVSYKYKWTDADKNPADNQLSEEEFMVFRHPEHSKHSLESMANNVMRGVDTDDDNIITEDEFVALPPGEVEGEEFKEMDKKWQEERRAEFRNITDENHDGKVDIQELKDYLDPTNPVQAKLEAVTLLSLMDDDKNGLLCMDEILKHSDFFISSKLVNFAANVHDEF